MNLKNIPTKLIPIGDILFDERNPNKMSDAQMDALNKTIDKYGFAADPWVNAQARTKKYLIIDGEHRVKLLRDRGVKFINCKVFRLKYSEVQVLRQIANKLRGSHDKKADAEEFRAIYESGNLANLAEMLATEEDDFKRILEKEYDDLNFGLDEEEVPEVPKKPKTKPGQIIKLGLHKIMCGDVTDPVAVRKLLGDRKIDLMFTDPPYNVAYEQGKFMAMDTPPSKFTKIKNDSMSEDDYQKFMEDVLAALKPFFENTPIYVCSAAMQSSLRVFAAITNAGFHLQCQIIWDKGQIILGRGDYQWSHENIWYGYTGNPHYWCGSRSLGTVWQIKRGNNKYSHPTQKPVDLPVTAIRNSSQKGGLVFDGFLGSGTTLIAAEQEGRICYGMEIEPGYVDVCIARYEAITGKKAQVVK